MEYYDAYGEFRGFETPRWNPDNEVAWISRSVGRGGFATVPLPIARHHFNTTLHRGRTNYPRSRRPTFGSRLSQRPSAAGEGVPLCHASNRARSRAGACLPQGVGPYSRPSPLRTGKTPRTSPLARVLIINWCGGACRVQVGSAADPSEDGDLTLLRSIDSKKVREPQAVTQGPRL